MTCAKERRLCKYVGIHLGRKGWLVGWKQPKVFRDIGWFTLFAVCKNYGKRNENILD